MIRLKIDNMKLLFDLRKPEYSYMIGFIQTDGYLRKDERGRGKMVIEINIRDKYILKKFQKLIPVYSYFFTRKKTVKFKKYKKIYKVTLAGLNCYNKQFRETVNYYGVPYGKKYSKISPPKSKYSENDYWRGIIDGDGSLGFTATNKPFISLVTCSSKLAKAYIEFINQFVQVERKVNKNKRDTAYNIVVTNEDSQKIISMLYYDNCLSIPRKYKMAKKILKWKFQYSSHNRTWIKKDIQFLINNPIEICLNKFKKVGRKEYNIKNQRWNERKQLEKIGIDVPYFKSDKYSSPWRNKKKNKKYEK